MSAQAIGLGGQSSGIRQPQRGALSLPNSELKMTNDAQGRPVGLPLVIPMSTQADGLG